MSQIFAIFVTVFIAELGDKTQIATLLFAAEKTHHPAIVFLACAGALTASTALAVLLGTAAGRYFEALPLKLIAGVGFMAIGVWTVISHFIET